MSPKAAADRPLHVLQVNMSDRIGGAQRVSRTLFEGYRKRGHVSWVAVGKKESDDPHVFEIPRPVESVPWAGVTSALVRILDLTPAKPHALRRARFWLDALSKGRSVFENRLGLESFYHPGSRHLLELVPARPDIVHAHNLHGKYFDLRYLPDLSRRVPTVVTLHDAWLLSGHCCHSFACTRWQTGCGKCPDLTIEVAAPRDLTAFNWRRKKRIYARSQLYVATPSRNLMSKVEQSILMPAVRQKRVIPYGIDLAVFRPGDRRAARAELDLPPDVPILLASAVWIRHNPWKDWKTLHTALGKWAALHPARPLLVLLLGEAGASERIAATEIRLMGFVDEPAKIARYYQAADIYLHPARSDTFPNTVLEALACGTPVIATAVGGIPEQVEHGETGYLLPPGDADAFVKFISVLLDDDPLRAQMGRCAGERARLRYDLNRQVEEYLEWYGEILASRASARTA